jgi:hypothetical protein
MQCTWDWELRALAAAIKPRWICEEAHQQMKEEPGLDHFEGRSWQGLHRHALMTLCQFSFCTQHSRIQCAERATSAPAARSMQPSQRLGAIGPTRSSSAPTPFSSAGASNLPIWRHAMLSRVVFGARPGRGWRAHQFTPAGIIDRLNKEINAGLADPRIGAKPN